MNKNTNKKMSNADEIKKMINTARFDNLNEQNLSTYINKYICDTIYILNFHINSFISKTNNNNTFNSLLKNEKINDEIKTIQIINNQLEKEIFYISNPKKEEISKFIEIICQRNNLLNILMNHYFEKIKSIEAKENILNTRIKLYSSLTKNKSMQKYIPIKYNKAKENKIDYYIKKIKDNNEFNHNNYSKYLNSYDDDLSKELPKYKDKYNRRNSENKKTKNKNKIILNKSYDALSINNIDTSCTYNNYDINSSCHDIKYMKNAKGRNNEPKIKIRKVNSIARTINKDLIIKNFKRDSSIYLKTKEEFHKLNLEKLSNIASNINLLKQNK